MKARRALWSLMTCGNALVGRAFGRFGERRPESLAGHPEHGNNPIIVGQLVVEARSMVSGTPRGGAEPGDGEQLDWVFAACGSLLRCPACPDGAHEAAG